jgi:DNA-binding YbaB/EbfC family protein
MFEGIKNISEIFSKLSDLKASTEELNRRMESIHVTGDAGAGMVQVIANGKGQILNVKINKAMFDSEDVKMMEDLIVAATNEALKKTREAMEHEYKKTIGVNPDDLMNMIKRGGGPV